MIYVYNKVEDKNEDYDYDYIDKIDFPEDFSIKITIDSKGSPCDLLGDFYFIFFLFLTL